MKKEWNELSFDVYVLLFFNIMKVDDEMGQGWHAGAVMEWRADRAVWEETETVKEWKKEGIK